MRQFNRSSGFAGVIGICFLIGLSGTAQGADDAQEIVPIEAENVLQKYPGARIAKIGDRVSMVYGKPMTSAPTPQAAVEAFVQEHITAFGVGRPTLHTRRFDDLGLGFKSVMVYDQTMDGLPVERSMVRVITHNDGDRSSVVLASGRMVARPEGGFRPDLVSAEQAVDRVATHAAWTVLQEFGPAEMVIYAGEGDEAQPLEAVRAWKFLGVGMGMDGQPIKHTFFIDASTGAIAGTRSEIHHGSNDVSGTVAGWGSPGTLPDIASNPPALLAMPEIRASISGGNVVFSDVSGLFTIQNGLPGPLSVIASVTNGRWVTVNNSAGTEISTTVAGVLPPGPVSIILNATPTAATTAQINAFIHQTIAHNYFRDRAPGFTALDTVVPANVNVNSTCNAVYDSSNNTTNFYAAGGGCVNTAYSSVVAHEYGHHIVNRLGLAQGAFGEGFSDTISMLAYDDKIIGRNFRTTNSNPIRDPDGANVQYPCSGPNVAVHYCGQIIGGIWWDLRTNMGAAYGEPVGLELTRQLHVDWALITGGGIGFDSAHPQTAIEVLTVDDDDADITNGTPNYALICDAFGQHSISCPPLSLLDFDYPNGQPASITPSGGATLDVVVTDLAGTPAPNTGVLFYSVANGPFQSISMTDLGSGSYQASFPAEVCGSEIRYYIQVGVQGGGVAQDPSGAPAETYQTLVGTGIDIALDDQIETLLPGWSVGVSGDTATLGQWTQGNPNGTAAQPEDDHTPSPGVNCFFTGQGPIGGGLGEADVDNGFTRLISPVLDLTDAGAVYISYWRWYSNNTGAEPNADVFLIDITNDGTNWVNVETVGPGGIQAAGGWYQHTFDVVDFVSPTANVRVRFTAQDLGGGSLVEAAVDDFKVTIIECSPPPPFCLGDSDGDVDVDFNDITTTLSNFGISNPLQGDADQSGDVNFNDITIILSNFGSTCN